MRKRCCLSSHTHAPSPQKFQLRAAFQQRDNMFLNAGAQPSQDQVRLN